MSNDFECRYCRAAINSWPCFECGNVPTDEYVRVVLERDQALKNYQWMVGHAADAKLDGYRELGSRVAAALDERDRARHKIAVLTRDLEIVDDHKQQARAELAELVGRLGLVSCDECGRWWLPEDITTVGDVDQCGECCKGRMR